MRAANKHDKIQEALELLNEAAKDKRNELYEAIEGKYDEIKDVLIGQAATGLNGINRVKKHVTRKLHAEEVKLAQKAKKLDRTIHRDPWPYVGAAALGALFVGIVLGKK